MRTHPHPRRLDEAAHPQHNARRRGPFVVREPLLVRPEDHRRHHRQRPRRRRRLCSRGHCQRGLYRHRTDANHGDRRVRLLSSRRDADLRLEGHGKPGRLPCDRSRGHGGCEQRDTGRLQARGRGLSRRRDHGRGSGTPGRVLGQAEHVRGLRPHLRTPGEWPRLQRPCAARPGRAAFPRRRLPGDQHLGPAHHLEQLHGGRHLEQRPLLWRHGRRGVGHRWQPRVDRADGRDRGVHRPADARRRVRREGRRRDQRRAEERHQRLPRHGPGLLHLGQVFGEELLHRARRR